MGGGAQGSKHQEDKWGQSGARCAALYGAASCGAACSSKERGQQQPADDDDRSSPATAEAVGAVLAQELRAKQAGGKRKAQDL